MPRSPRNKQPANLPVSSSWRMVEQGDNDSFDTSIVQDYEEDPLLSSNPPSQLSSSDSQGIAFGSQDSYSGVKAEEDLLIKRMSFTPSIASTRRDDYFDKETTPVPEFKMPRVDVASPSKRTSRSAKTARGLPTDESYTTRRRGWREPEDYEYPPMHHYSTRSRPAAQNDRDSQRPPKTLSDRFTAAVPEFLFNTAAWFLSILGMALQMAKWPLALMLVVYFLIGASMTTKNIIFGNISALPICHVPFISLPFCDPVHDARTNGSANPDFDFRRLVSAQDDFEKVLETSAEGVSLPMEMKRSEATVRDLRTMVKYSQLSSREDLVFELDGYVDNIRTISGDLQAFNTHVGSAVDSVISINRWTSRYIDTIASHAEEGSHWSDWLFTPFQPVAFDERNLVDKYIEHTALVSDKISTLILEAQATLRLLSQAEGNLQAINEHVVRDGNAVREKHSEVWWDLWTLVGANTRRLHNLSSQISLLKQVEAQRTSAVSQLMGLVHDLGDIQTKLGDLRDRVAAPELLADEKGHHAIPLSVHIETINAGVERLETARGRIRAEENERLQRALARAREEDRLIEG